MFEQIQALSRKPQSHTADALLKKLASHVQKIMKKRGWKVKKLTEFYPSNPHLLGLNINKTYEIKIRLRPSGSPDRFLEWNDVLGTLLHELCHIVRGPHDASFYSLLDQLFTEYEEWVDQGSPLSMDGPGNVVGAGSQSGPRNLPPHLSRQKALEQAEKRRRLSSIMPSGGRTVGTSIGGIWGLGMSAKALERRYTPSQLAGMAAERRLQDEQRCGQCMEKEAMEEETEILNNSVAQEESCSVSPSNIIQSSFVSPNKRLQSTSVSPHQPSVQQPSTPVKRPWEEDDIHIVSIKSSSSHWTCPTCSLDNPIKALVCNACDYIYSSTKGWACPFCTFINDTHLPTCQVCLKLNQDKQ